MQLYEDYTEKTRSGQHGKTAQYWIMYIDLVVLHLLFSHAVRTNDMDFLFTVWVKYIPYYLLPTIQALQDIWLGII